MTPFSDDSRPTKVRFLFLRVDICFETCVCINGLGITYNCLLCIEDEILAISVQAASVSNISLLKCESE